MKRLVALLVGVLAVVAVLFYALRRDSKSATKTSPEVTAETHATAARSTTPSPRLVGAAPVVEPKLAEHANIEGLPDALEPGYLAVEHAAKGCYRGRPAPKPIRENGPDETIESIRLSYRQISSHGVGHVEDMKVNNGALTDQALQSCIVKMAAAATWSSSAPDGEIGDLEQNIVLGDLMRPDHGLPPMAQRSPMPTAPPPPELAGPLGKQAELPEDDHPGVVVSAPRP
jgi:hypothetical protein